MIHNGENPCFEVCADFKLMKKTKGSHTCVLNQILGIAFLSCQIERKSVEVVEVNVKQLFEGLLCALMFHVPVILLPSFSAVQPVVRGVTEPGRFPSLV